MLFAIAGHDADGDGDRSAASSSWRSRCCRWRCTCSPASAATRRRPPKRRSSTSCSARSRARSSSTASRSPTASPAARGSIASASLMAAQALSPTPMQLLARRPAARRLRVQGVGRAVPHVDARRLRRRAAVGHRRSCPPASRPRRSPRSSACSSPRSSRCARTGRPSLGDRGGDDDRRHGGRRGAVQRQADARVLEHRARRLPAASRCSSATTSARARCCSIC